MTPLAPGRPAASIATVVSGERHSRVCAHSPAGSLVRRVSLRDLATGLVDLRGVLVVIDQSCGRDEAVEAAVAAVATSGSRLVLYFDASPEAFRRVLRVSQMMPTEALVAGIADEATVLRAHLNPGCEGSVASHLLHKLATPLSEMPRALAVTATGLFVGGTRIPASVSDFLTGVRMHQRTAQMWIRRTGIRSASDLLWCARIARIHPALNRRGTLESIADAHSLHIRSVASAFKRLAGLPLRSASRSMNTLALASRISESAQRRR